MENINVLSVLNGYDPDIWMAGLVIFVLVLLFVVCISTIMSGEKNGGVMLLTIFCFFSLVVIGFLFNNSIKKNGEFKQLECQPCRIEIYEKYNPDKYIVILDSKDKPYYNVYKHNNSYDIDKVELHCKTVDEYNMIRQLKK